MPKFPTYHGELPDRLNPLNLRHYFLLAYWIYFRPTALKCYLYQADPELYRAGPGRDIFRTWRVPAYRNLYFMVPGVAVPLSVLVGMATLLVVSWLKYPSVDWLGWIVYTVIGVMASVAVGVMLGVTRGVSNGVAAGIMTGVASGVAAGVMSGIWFIISPFSRALAAALGRGLDLAVGEAANVRYGVTFGLTAGATVGVMFGAFGVQFGVALSMLLNVVIGVVLGAAFGVVGGLTGSRWYGVMLGTTFSVVFGVGASHILFYPLQFILALRATFQKKHPLEWDELTILPLPNTRRALTRRLLQSERDGLRFLAEISSNPFQRWATQQVLQIYLHDQGKPLHLLYTILTFPDLDSFLLAPVSEKSWKLLPTTRQLLLGELGRRWVDCSSHSIDRLAERLVWALTQLPRDRRNTPLTRFAGMLYELLDQEVVGVDNFDLAAYADVYTDLTDYAGGEEIARTFRAMAAFLNYDALSDLPKAADVGQRAVSSYDEPIRPPVLTTLDRLSQVATEIATYQDATSRVNQLAALARATDALDDLDEYVSTEVMAPERYILRRIIRQWRRLVSEAGGEVGRIEEVGPVANPYVAGNPVIGEIFVGREDILRRLEELWSGAGQKPSVVLYGHRRMGKSSILHNLGARFGPQTVIVDFNMQRVGLVESTGELLYNLALALYDAQILNVAGTFEHFAEPGEEHFVDHNPYTAFDRFLKRLDQVRDDYRFIVTVDEFELIERLITEDKLDTRLLDFWRGLIQTYPWFVMAFAGLHTLQEMTHDYWHPLYGSVQGIPVSFLSREAAWRLITQPTPDFPLDYDREAVERIIALTNGQPYLMQLIGHGLVTCLNRQTFEEGVERERHFSVDDIEAVINAPEFFRDGDAYFTGVWRQAETSEPSGQPTVLGVLAQMKTGLPAREIARQTDISLAEVEGALKTLARHDVVQEEEDGHWRFTVELMRRWVLQREEE